MHNVNGQGTDISPMQPTATTPQQLLSSIFGYDEFRPLQATIIENIMAKRDTLVIMPTGGGKSLCFQIPALLFEGLTVVVSPLISLMQDQVYQLHELGVAAVYLNSTLSHQEYTETTHRLRRGEVKLLYVAPETLLRPETLVLLGQCQLSCLTIDEAHCISQWGHDFRPEYRQMMSVRQRFPQAVCVALTATATPRVQADIKQTMGFQEENEFLASFDRKNLFINVESKRNIVQQTLNFVTAHPKQSGIIYCSTRKRVDELYRTLVEHEISALPYHAGLDAGSRQRNQDAFIKDDVSIIVATVAFGMGIDKPDVRFVLHIDLPKTIEDYYQQIGRAGRDSLPADCLLLFSYSDVHTIYHFIQAGAESEAEGRKARVKALVNWAESSQCRRHDLLAYFGERYEEEGCQNCDNCLRPEEEKVELTVPAQKFLSCIARTKQLFGMTHIINVLRGSKSKNVLNRGHDQLSTYGIGMEFSAEQWKFLAQQFIQQKLIVQDIQHRSLQLTKKAMAVFKGEQVWGLLMEVEQQESSGANAVPLDYDGGLFEQLRAKRKTLADAANIPPYIVFSDQSLQEMATYFPHSVNTFGQMHGVGARKIEQYAEPFLALIQSYCAEHQLDEKPKAMRQRERPAKATGSNTIRSRKDDVGTAFLQGQTIADLMQSYGVKRTTVISNLQKFVQSGQQIPVDLLKAGVSVPEEVQAEVLAAFDQTDSESLTPVYDALQGRVGYEELRLIRLIYWMKDQSTFEQMLSQPSHEERLAQTKAQYPRAYEPWTEDEKTALQHLAQTGHSVEEISAQMQRQPGGIRSQLKKFEMVTA